MRYEITTRGEDKRVMEFKDIDILDVMRNEQVSELEREDFTVYINLLQKLPFQFDGEGFYLDVEDVDANQNKLDELVELTDGKSEDEAKKIMQEHAVQYIKRQRVFLVTEGKPLEERVNEYIKFYSL